MTVMDTDNLSRVARDVRVYAKVAHRDSENGRIDVRALDIERLEWTIAHEEFHAWHFII
jgi:hypothetical protein